MNATPSALFKSPPNAAQIHAALSALERAQNTLDVLAWVYPAGLWSVQSDQVYEIRQRLLGLLRLLSTEGK